MCYIKSLFGLLLGFFVWCGEQLEHLELDFPNEFSIDISLLEHLEKEHK